MAKLGTLQHSYGRQAHAAGQIRRGEAHPNSMRVVIVDPMELLPGHGVAICWNMHCFKPTTSDVTTTDYLPGEQR